MSDQPKALSEEKLAHAKFFILFLLSYFLAENITLLLNSNVPGFFTPFLVIFQNLTLSIFTVLFLLVLARVLVGLVPELSTEHQPSPYVGIISALIISHPLYIALSASTLTVNWLVIDLIENQRLLEFFLEVILFTFAGYAIVLIQARSPIRKDRYYKILKYVGDDIVLGLSVGLLSFYLIRTFISEGLESLTLTIPVRMILILLLYFATDPLEKSEDTTSK